MTKSYKNFWMTVRKFTVYSPPLQPLPLPPQQITTTTTTTTTTTIIIRAELTTSRAKRMSPWK
jgi:hypothetical protein